MSSYDREIEPTDTRPGPYFSKECQCPNCSHKWVEVIRYSDRGIKCPLCKHEDPEYSWLENIMQE